MTHTTQKTRLAFKAWAVAFAVFGTIGASQAAQFVPARDGDSTMVKISIKDDTRIKVEGSKILDVVGDFFDKEKNPQGRLTLDKDSEDGEIYVQPTSFGLEPTPGAKPGEKGPLRPVKITLKTTRGKYSLLLMPDDIPGDTIIVEPKGLAINFAKGSKASVQPAPATSVPEQIQTDKSSSHIRKLKAFVLAMVSRQQPGNMEVVPAGEEVGLWKEAKFVLVEKWVGEDWVGDRYNLTNVSTSPLVMDEREFYRQGVVGVSIRLHDLQPGESTEVYIVRQRLQGE